MTTLDPTKNTAEPALIAELQSQLAKLRESHDTFRLVAEDAPNMVFLNAGGRIAYANRRACEVMGYTLEEFGRADFNFMALIDEDSREHVRTSFVAHMRGQEVAPQEYVLVTKDGRRIEAIHATRLIVYQGERAILGIVTDVTERNLAARALRASEERYRKLAEASPDGIVISDAEGICRVANDTAARILGYASSDDLIGRQQLDVVLDEDRARVVATQHALAQGSASETVVCHARKASGAVISLENNVSALFDEERLVGYVTAFRDVTSREQEEAERRRVGAKLEHTQRLESLGVLAGVLAHDFNNLLVGMLGNAALLADELQAEDPRRELAEQIQKAASRAADLVAHMLSYAGRRERHMHAVDLREITHELMTFVKAAVPKNVRIVVGADEQIAPILGNAGQLQQVIMNLVLNAAEASGEHGGIVAVTLRMVHELPELTLNSLPEPTPGSGWVSMSVVDRGMGMGSSIAARMFDPFYTTKTVGRGLGLAAVAGILRYHRAGLSVQSESGSGTEIQVLFPCLTNVTPRATPQRTSTRRRARAAKVLVVDDEKLVRSLAARALSREGFEVQVAESGREAVELVERGSSYDVVLLDVTMPHMNGEEVHARMRVHSPNLPIVLSSGFALAEIAERLRGLPHTAFLQKPYAPGEVVEAVFMALDDVTQPPEPP